MCLKDLCYSAGKNSNFYEAGSNFSYFIVFHNIIQTTNSESAILEKGVTNRKWLKPLYSECVGNKSIICAEIVGGLILCHIWYNNYQIIPYEGIIYCLV